MRYSRAPMPLPDSGMEADVFSNAKITSDLQIPANFIKNKSTPTPKPVNTNKGLPLPTNDHITSLLVPSNNDVPSYVQPFIYTLLRESDGGAKTSIALSSAHKDQKVIGDHYAYNPVAIYEIIIRNIGICKLDDEDIVFDKGNVSLVQGQGLVTVEVSNNNDDIFIDSQIGIRDVYDIKGSNSKCFGVQLNNNRRWIIYTDYMSINVQRNSNNGMFQLSFNGNNGVIQLFPDTNEYNSLLSLDFNTICSVLKLGNYVQKMTISTSSESKDILQFNYHLKYQDKEALIFLLPHHLIDLKMSCLKKTKLQLYSTVYGTMEGFYTSGKASFDYSRQKDDLSSYDILSDKKDSVFHIKINYLLDNLPSIREILINNDFQQCMNNLEHESNLDSMYFSGKVFNKYAWLLYVSAELLHDNELSEQLFTKISECLEKFIQNQQILPLLYDTKWGGIISSGDMNQDFGNSMYNDHQFHYGYFVLTFAILGWYKPDWFAQNKFYSDLLLRDYCNIDGTDDKFVKFRNFNWFEGHSWANGVWPSLDGRDQESSSEDYNSVYAMFLYGSATKNYKMQQIAKLQLNIMKRSNNLYFLYKDKDFNNEVSINEMKKNKVCGIFFQNKIDYATYFGLNTEYIHMIHFIPGTFISRYIRDNDFVTEEWNQKLKNINIDNNGWNGLLKLNKALISPDPIDFFKDVHFNKSNLDNGQSQTLSLVLAILWNT
ncbi:hypothetical protein ACO0R3_002839 [Hanseniaspora guilliermondii]